MSQDPLASTAETPKEGELFSLLLRLQVLEGGELAVNTGPHVQAAFLDIVRQSDPALSAWLHTPNQRRPYTLSLLDGFYHRSPAEYINDATAQQRALTVKPGQIYWLRVTLLDATIFHAFVSQLLLKAQALVVRLGSVPFVISRIIGASEHSQDAAATWAAYSSFQELYTQDAARRYYTFEFTTPTVFSRGQRAWGKQFMLFPTPGMLFDNLARQWDCFAPASLRIANAGLTGKDVELWCDEQMVVSQYALSTTALHANRFGQVGFRGQISYDVKGNPLDPVAKWLTSLARFAFFSGVGYKTAMGMGQTRCLSLLYDRPTSSRTGASERVPKEEQGEGDKEQKVEEGTHDATDA